MRLPGAIDSEAAWAAANVDEDWNIEQWGADTLALDRRALRSAEMAAATRVLAEVETRWAGRSVAAP